VRADGAAVAGGAAWLLAGNVTYAAGQWLTVVLLARVAGPTELGLYALGLAITAPIFQGASFQLRSLVAIEPAGGRPVGAFVALRMLLTACALVFTLVIAAWRGFSGDTSTAAVIVTVMAMRVVESASDLVGGLLLRSERQEDAARSIALRAVLGIVGAVVGVALGGGAAAAAIGGTIGFAASLLAHDAPKAASCARLRPAFEPRVLRSILVEGAPLGAALLLLALQVNVPRYLLEQSAGPTEVGVLAALGYPPAAMTMVAIAAGQAASPALARAYGVDERAFYRLTSRLLAFSATLGGASIAVVWIAGPRVLVALYGVPYAAYETPFLTLTATGGLLCAASVLGAAMTAARRFRSQVAVLAASVLATAACGVARIPSGGIEGAAEALLCGALAQAALSSVVVHAAMVRWGLASGGRL